MSFNGADVHDAHAYVVNTILACEALALESVTTHQGPLWWSRASNVLPGIAAGTIARICI